MLCRFIPMTDLLGNWNSISNSTKEAVLWRDHLQEFLQVEETIFIQYLPRNMILWIPTKEPIHLQKDMSMLMVSLPEINILIQKCKQKILILVKHKSANLILNQVKDLTMFKTMELKLEQTHNICQSMVPIVDIKWI